MVQAKIGKVTKSNPVLTKEQDEFYRLLRLRAASKAYGQPYIAFAIFRLIPISAPGLGTMGVDKHYRVYIDFDYMMDKGIEFASKVLNHEPWHLLRNHEQRSEPYRGRNFSADEWNLAGDAELNDDIEHLVPAESIFPSSFGAKDGQTVETYYEMLLSQRPESPEGEQGDSGEGDDSGQGKGKGGSQSSGNSGEGDSESGQGTPDNQDSDDGQGSGEGQKSDSPNPNLPQNPVCKSGSELDDYRLEKGEADTVDDFEQEMVSRQVAQSIKDEVARDPGRVPQGHRLWAEEKLAKTPTPWQKILRGAVKSALAWQKGKVDYVRSRPARRQVIKGVISPALLAPKAKVLVGVDTSGSHVPMLPRVMAELGTIIKSAGIRGDALRVFSVDTEVKGSPAMVNDPTKLDFKGGGGTAMRPAFDYSKKAKKDHDIFILFTDGELPSGDYPASQPTSDVRYVICILGWEDDNYSKKSYDRAVEECGKWAKVVQVSVPRND